LAIIREMAGRKGRQGVSSRIAGTINERILQVRKALGYTQGQFADGLSLSRSFIAGLEIGRKKVNERLIRLVSLGYGVNEDWLRSGQGEMFPAGEDPRLERIIRNFNSMDPLLQDYVLKYLDWLADYYAKPPEGDADEAAGAE
jgi:transcriptional regulator with XRE-family HTH domain